mmetsp:Transcript_52829/g.123599  ORF Transcript_52829/g.123599 Transcript_52829/m.123599 type:complete len:661 (+) Transcript_52829:68-2050(+)
MRHRSAAPFPWGRAAVLYAWLRLGTEASTSVDWITAGCVAGRDIEAIELLQHRAAPVSDADVQRPSKTEDMLSTSRCRESKEEEKKYGMKVLSVKQNNLGGLGPDRGGAPELRLHVEMGTSARELDLVIVNASTYLPNNVNRNAVEHGSLDLFRINVKGGGTNADFNATFVDPRTQKPVVLEDIFITWFDVDKYNAAMTHERLYVKGFYNYSLTDTSDLIAAKEGEWTMVKPSGMGADGIQAAEASDRSVRLHYKNSSGFAFKCVMMGPSTGGWNFLFSGIAAIPTCQQAQPTPQGYSCDIFGDPRTSAEGNSSSVFVESDPSGLLLRTFDGNQAYLHGMLRDTARIGDMWLVKSKDVSIQGRFGFAENSMKSYLQAVALSGPLLDNNTLILGPTTSTCQWGDEEILSELDSTMELELPSGDFIKAKYQSAVQNIRYSTRTTQGVEVILPKGVTLVLNRFEAFVGLRINFKSHDAGHAVDGGCGNLNGDPNDDDLVSLEARMDPFVGSNESFFQHYNLSGTPAVPDGYVPEGPMVVPYTLDPITMTASPTMIATLSVTSRPAQTSNTTVLRLSTGGNETTTPLGTDGTTLLPSWANDDAASTMPAMSSLQRAQANSSEHMAQTVPHHFAQQGRNVQMQVQTHIPVVFAAPLEFLFGNANR